MLAALTLALPCAAQDKIVIPDPTAAPPTPDPKTSPEPQPAPTPEPTPPPPGPGGLAAPLIGAPEEVEVKPAKEPSRFAWIIRPKLSDSPEDRSLALQLAAIFTRVLKGSGDTHIVATDPRELGAYLNTQQRDDFPDCLEGLSECPNPRAVTLQALDVDRLLSGTLTRDGDAFTLTLTLVDASGHAAATQTFRASAARTTPEGAVERIAIQAAGAMFDATASMEVVTTPSGATIRIDNKRVGTSPLIVATSVGLHTVEANLDHHAGVTLEVNVGKGERKRVDLNLSSKASTVTVDTAPLKGTVYIDNKAVGPTNAPFTLAPGEYQLEVRAPEHKPRFMRLVVGPRERKVVSMSLRNDRPSLYLTGLGGVETEAIVARNYHLRVNYRYARVLTNFQDGEGDLGGQTFKVQPVEANVTDIPDFGFHGLHLEAGYSGVNWGIIALGLSYFSSGDELDTNLASDSTTTAATLRDFTRLELRPAQLLWRYAYKNLLPAVQTGFGYTYNSFTADTPLGASDFSRDGLFWQFTIEASYFFDPLWCAYAAIGVQRDLSHDDSKTQQFVSFGIGLTFENPLDEIGTPPPKRQP